jgi:hypothetical protein
LWSIHAWLVCHYEFFKDFAGPVATIFAAAVVAVITFRFGQIQARIAREQAVTAEQQAKVALDQLRYNLFDKRYEIYRTARDLLQTLINDALKKNFVVPSLISFFVKLDEARFFYPPEICKLLNGFDKDVINLYALVAEQNRTGISDLKRAELGDKTVDELKRIEGLLQSLPGLFETDLKFPQLTDTPLR